MRSRREPRWARAASATLAAAIVLMLAARGRGSEDGWRPPMALLTIEQPLRDPILLADTSGTVHLFFLVRRTPQAGLPDTLMYARRDGAGWSVPIVALGGDDPLTKPAAVVDGLGFVHVTYSGKNGRLIHWRAHLSRLADGPEAWRDQQVLSEGGTLSSALLLEGTQTLHLAYASRGADIHYRRSDDGGRNWSDPVRVSEVGASSQATDAPRIARDGRGRLHVVWTQFQLPSGWPPMGSYYSRSLDGGAKWSPPRQLSGEGYGAAGVVSRGDGEVHIVWDSLHLIGERVHEWSADGGATWTDPRVITRAIWGGWTGGPALEFDSAGRLHLVTSVDGPNNVEAIFHLVWDGTTWSEPELVSGGTVAKDSVEFPTLAVSDGNHLHVAYEVDYRGVWYADGVVDAPAIAPRPVPTMPTGLWARARDTSMAFRFFAVVFAVLAIEAGVRSIWRARHRGGG